MGGMPCGPNMRCRGFRYTSHTWKEKKPFDLDLLMVVGELRVDGSRMRGPDPRIEVAITRTPPCGWARRFSTGCLGWGGRRTAIIFFRRPWCVFLFVAPMKSAMADADAAPPLAHASSLQPLQRPPSPVFRAPLDLVVTAGGSDIPLDINLAVKGIHVPSLQYRLQQQQQAFRRDRRDHRSLHRRPNVTVERVPPLPPPSLRPPRSTAAAVSSLSAASASCSQFDAATNANQVRLEVGFGSV